MVQYRPMALVVGLPAEYGWQCFPICPNARVLSLSALHDTLACQPILADERLSSWAVKDDDVLTGDIHARSACLIAETFLNDFSACLPVKTELHHPT